MRRTTASLVVYQTPLGELMDLLQSLSTDALMVAWVVVDNSATVAPDRARELQLAVEALGGRYVAAHRNVGFGAGHNLGVRALADTSSEFHLFVNPDILLGPEVLEQMASALDAHPDAVLGMPRIVYADGSPQHLCKLLPTPLDFALRRFSPPGVQHLFRSRLDRYEMRGIEDIICDRVPFLSGCFMFIRRAALERVGGFDERYFLYMEDVDLCRRLAKHGRLLYWPKTSVVHGCFRGAYRSTALMMTFVRSAVTYFNRWGWLFDEERRRRNREALGCLQKR